MLHYLRWAVALASFFLGITTVSHADAVKLRRPYAANIVFNYGFDNRAGGGCTDFNCGGYCYDGHTGTDQPLGLGTDVLAGEQGTVVGVNNTCADYGSYGNTCGGRCGNYVRIRHPDGQDSLYCHMRRNSLVVSVGQSVSCGQKIGQSASSGSSTGPHLHLGWTSSAGTRDVFRGSCTSSPGAWRDQRGYREAVGTGCGCVPSPEVCDGRDNDCDGVVDNGEVCELDLLRRQTHAYDPPRTTDVNGDGLQDVCARYGAGWGCTLSTGTGWGERIQTTLFNDDGGWGSPQHYATIRMGDVDGDGRADVCARHSTNGYQCYRSTGTGFEHYGDAAVFTNDNGWSKPEYYTTFRLADVNGDGMDDVCARSAAGWICELSTGSGFSGRVTGPEWKDDSGYNRTWYYGTIRTGHLNDDNMMDVCIRRAAGFDCYLSNGNGFDHYALLEDFSNDGGWTDRQYWSTIRLADFDGDGLDDVCARFAAGLQCLRNNGEGFDSPLMIAALSNASGWSDPSNYETLRIGDINADGGVDFCARANAGVNCYGAGADGEMFSWVGPRWSDENGWTGQHYYQTITVTDLTPDRRRDICGRGSAGLHCHAVTDDGYEAYPVLDSFSSAGGWDAEKYYSTIRLGSGTCGEEICNGFDDDCDGAIDEGYPTKIGPIPPQFAAELVDVTYGAPVKLGEAIATTIRFKNVGLSPWTAGQIGLRAVATNAADIAAVRAGWEDDTLAAVIDEATAPGATATITFDVLMVDDLSIYGRIDFALEADQQPIACPAPITKINPGDPLNEGTGTGTGTGTGPGGTGTGNTGTGTGDGKMAPHDTTTVNISSCSAAPVNAPASAPAWVLLLVTFGVVRRRRQRRLSAASVAVVAATVACLGCDSPKQAPEATVEPVAPANELGELSTTTGVDDSTEWMTSTNPPAAKFSIESMERSSEPPSLLAVYGDWVLWGNPRKALPNSDQPPRMVAELMYQGTSVEWPLGGELLSTATFIPTGTSSPMLAVRQPRGELMLIRLNANNPADSTVLQIDEPVGFVVAASADGCCLAYMRGEMGLQAQLVVYDLRTQTSRTIEVGHNAWSPTISPDGAQVMYVAPLDDGSAGIFVYDIATNDTQLLVEGADVFPASSQPPVWTDSGVVFAAEQGVYRVDFDGKFTALDRNATGLLVNALTGDMYDGFGDEL